VVAVSSTQVKSTTDTSAVGTRNAMPVSLPLRAGITLVTALAAPVELGMMLPEAHRPPRQSLLLLESTTFWVAVMACTVVMRPILMPYASFTAFTMGARPLVVQLAHETAFMSLVYAPWFTPYEGGARTSAGMLRSVIEKRVMQW
jgi:hypothetical protein